MQVPHLNLGQELTLTGLFCGFIHKFQQQGYKYIKEHQKLSLQESEIQVSL
jgi:hypothetical protein